ncbi:CoA transferase [Umezawaea endophytica]|uniref:CoA transferase n=1 Tax=Umezawaea endophytica TaxID=1654476 RepID=A0A9X2ZZ05_9PSEU|nr:CoA transferase [Umezawaea endophytica]MCS7475423.1 CoA transferase [Umezawaea endophytica]
MTPHLDRTSTDPPLVGTEITVRGTSAAADVLGALLQQSGAVVARFPDAADLSARVEVAGAGGVDVEWAGPVRGGDVVDEVSAQAVCGPAHVHGRATGAPAGLGLDYCGTAAGVLAGTGLLAQRLALLRHGTARDVTTSVAQAALLTVSQYLAAAGAPDGEAAPIGPGGPPFRSADGTLFEVEALDPAVWSDFWARVGAPRDAVAVGWRPFQFRYATAAAPLPQELARAAARLRFTELVEHADRSAMSVCELVPHSRRLAESVPLPAWELAPLGGGFDHVGPPPGHDGSPLSGVVVLEAGRRVQAPLAAHLLRLLGAEVVRIEPPGGDPLRGMPPSCGDTSARWLALNRGKSAVEIDIKDPRDRDRLRELVSTADVFLHNWAPGKAESLGLGAEDLSAVNPALVHAHTSGWAGRLRDAPMGTDFMAQARTGLGELLRPADEPPAPSLMTLLDVLGGLLGAHATVAALLARERTGRGVRCESSLLAAADLLHLRAEGRPPPGFRRPARTADGWCAPSDGHPDVDVRDLSTVDAIRAFADRGTHAVRVTDDLATIPTDPRFADAVHLDPDRCPAVLTPWGLR